MAQIDHETWWVNSNGYEEGYVWRNGKRQQFKRARWLMEQYLGRPLKRSEVVHHKNGNKLDNRRENLELKTNGGHTKDHHKGRVYKRGYKYTISDEERERRSNWIRTVHQVRHQRALEKARGKYAERRQNEGLRQLQEVRENQC